MLNTYSKFLIGGACVLLLAGCETMGTSTAGYSPEEDAFTPQARAAVAANTPSVNSGTATGTALFDQRTGAQLYGASPFPVDSSSSSQGNNPYVTSSALKGKLAVTRIHAKRNGSNLLTVSAGLKNQSGHSLPLQIETVYKDKDNDTVSSQEKWVTLTLKPHEESQYSSTATTEDATDFMMRIRKVSATPDAKP